MSGALSGARMSRGDDAVVISEPPPSGAPTAPGSTVSVARTPGVPSESHDPTRVRELRLPGRGARAGAAGVRDAGDLGHGGGTRGRRGDRAVVRVVPVAVPARAGRGRRGGLSRGRRRSADPSRLPHTDGLAL